MYARSASMARQILNRSDKKGEIHMQTVPRDQIQFRFDPALAPVMEISSGDTVRFECQDCYAEQLTEDGMEFGRMDMRRNNPITGPVRVREAAPGDILKVEVLGIELKDHGVMCVRTGKGIYEVEGCHCRKFQIRNDTIRFDNGLGIPTRPMIGVIGTCPAEPETTQVPGEHGGNLDIRELGIGSTVYLPVAVPGANLSMGDIHAIQGDGETAICGMECSGTVTVRVTVLKDRHDIPTPFVVSGKSCYTTAAHESLDTCHVAAARKMHRFLMDQAHLSDAQAAMLLSLCGNLRITQVVNPKKGCMMEFPLEVLERLGAEQ